MNNGEAFGHPEVFISVVFLHEGSLCMVGNHLLGFSETVAISGNPPSTSNPYRLIRSYWNLETASSCPDSWFCRSDCLSLYSWVISFCLWVDYKVAGARITFSFCVLLIFQQTHCMPAVFWSFGSCWCKEAYCLPLGVSKRCLLGQKEAETGQPVWLGSRCR
jgi:hypothetical protein